MKRSLLLALLVIHLIALKTHCQVQKRFFVEDVKTVEYVTVKFCVGDDAKINKVTVVDAQTTYKNKEVIEDLKEYLLSIQYYPDSKLRNNCYNSTFDFINSAYQDLSLTKEEC